MNWKNNCYKKAVAIELGGQNQDACLKILNENTALTLNLSNSTYLGILSCAARLRKNASSSSAPSSSLSPCKSLRRFFPRPLALLPNNSASASLYASYMKWKTEILNIHAYDARTHFVLNLRNIRISISWRSIRLVIYYGIYLLLWFVYER